MSVHEYDEKPNPSQEKKPSKEELKNQANQYFHDSSNPNAQVALEALQASFNNPSISSTSNGPSAAMNNQSSTDNIANRFNPQQPQQPPQGQIPPQGGYYYDPNVVQKQPGKEFDWIEIEKLNPFQINPTIASHELSLIEKSIKEILDEHICRDLDITVIPIDKSSAANLAVSVIVIAVRPKNEVTIRKDENGKIIPYGSVAYHGLLIEGSIESLPPRYQYTNGYQQQPVEVLTLTSDLNDDILNSIIRREVKKYFPGSRLHVPASNEVVPRKFDMTIRENIYKVTVNAIMACQAVLAQVNKNFVDLNLAYAKNTSFLTQTIRFGKNQEEDIFGNPIRSDITLDMIAQVNPQQGGSNWLNRGEQKVITHVNAYIDLLYNDVTNQFGTQGYSQATQFDYNQFTGMNGYIAQPVYMPQMVITHLFNTKIQTLPGLLLAVINASSITENGIWIQALLPDHANGREDMNDIGNIGLDISLKNDGTFEKLKTTPDVFGYHQLQQVVKKYFHTGLSIAIDVPECSQTSWAFKALRNAARVGKAKTSTLNLIENAANLLTNGRFSHYYSLLNGSGFFIKGGPSTRVTLGYYINADGVKRDKRDFDYLAAAGFAGKKGNRDEIISYTDSFNNATHYNINEQIDIRRKIESSYLPGLVYTGYAERLVFEAAFITALRQGAKDCGYNVNTTENLHLLNQIGVRTNQLYQNNKFLLGEDPSGIFNNLGYRGLYTQPQGQPVYQQPTNLNLQEAYYNANQAVIQQQMGMGGSPASAEDLPMVY